MKFKGKAKRLDEMDVPKIARGYGIEEDALRAVLDVETLGGGFDRHGRPKMLFEPHVFWRLLGPGPQRDRAARLDLAYPKWGMMRYPRDSYPRLHAAYQIDPVKALKAASWGMGQVLGENHHLAGWPTVENFVKAMVADEENHLIAMVNYIKNKGLISALNAHDWEKFARGYNGPGYRKNRYHKKLAKAYAKWRRIPDRRFRVIRHKPKPRPWWVRWISRLKRR